jgi:hypothetical protein
MLGPLLCSGLCLYSLQVLYYSALIFKYDLKFDSNIIQYDTAVAFEWIQWRCADWGGRIDHCSKYLSKQVGPWGAPRAVRVCVCVCRGRTDPSLVKILVILVQKTTGQSIGQNRGSSGGSGQVGLWGAPRAVNEGIRGYLALSQHQHCQS